mmetsp:Transcript_16552/g.33445  ORF Transcript_16552/g.33445 Transcript_16552/m.33445 type:complete len:244 (-) Transcript_16552:473-1204(-)
MISHTHRRELKVKASRRGKPGSSNHSCLAALQSAQSRRSVTPHEISNSLPQRLLSADAAWHLRVRPRALGRCALPTATRRDAAVLRSCRCARARGTLCTRAASAGGPRRPHNRAPRTRAALAWRRGSRARVRVRRSTRVPMSRARGRSPPTGGGRGLASPQAPAPPRTRRRHSLPPSRACPPAPPPRSRSVAPALICRILVALSRPSSAACRRNRRGRRAPRQTLQRTRAVACEKRVGPVASP